MNLREKGYRLFLQALWFPFSCYLVVYYTVGFSLLGLVRHTLSILVSQPNLSWTRTRSILLQNSNTSDSCQK